MKKQLFLFLVITIMLAIAGLGGAATSSVSAVKKIAILPFTMNSDRDLTFLQSGIMDMLSSRLYWKDKIDVIEKGAVLKTLEKFPGPMDKQKALETGRALKADYVILGSLTVFGDSVSIDAKILDVTKGEELVTAFEQSKGMDGVIPTVNKFAEDINAKVMGKYVGKKVRSHYKEFHQADMQATWADISKAKELLNWHPQFSLEEGIKRTVDWTINNLEWIQKIKI